MKIADLKNALEVSWSSATSYYPNKWNKNNPALGQCAVTALIINDYLGGKIVWAEARLPDKKFISHYFNFIKGREIDLTRSQFPLGTFIPKGVEKLNSHPNSRDYILYKKDTQRRYNLLKRKVKRLLA